MRFSRHDRRAVAADNNIAAIDLRPVVTFGKRTRIADQRDRLAFQQGANGRSVEGRGLWFLDPPCNGIGQALVSARKALPPVCVADCQLLQKTGLPRQYETTIVLDTIQPHGVGKVGCNCCLPLLWRQDSPMEVETIGIELVGKARRDHEADFGARRGKLGQHGAEMGRFSTFKHVVTEGEIGSADPLFAHQLKRQACDIIRDRYRIQHGGMLRTNSQGQAPGKRSIHLAHQAAAFWAARAAT
jgi:hypothetical protein